MNKKGFYLIIFFMTTALIGLMVIQSYWIKNAMVVKEATFIKNVNEAMIAVVYNLEKIEAAEQLSHRNNQYNNQYLNQESFDSVGKVFFENQFNLSDPWMFDRFMNKSTIFWDIFEQFYSVGRNQPVEDRINPQLLDSLIDSELVARGIKTAYEFGIYDRLRNMMPVQKTGMYPRELLSRGFSYSLFPNDLDSNNDILMVFFPKERRFLITQLWGLLFISIVFILIIIFSFAYTIMTILKQKKLSEIKSDFINNMTHEFKTPIATISLACEALSDKDVQKSGDIYDSYIKVIDEENKRLGKMSENILQSATLDKGHINLKMAETDIHETIQNAVRKVNLQVEKKKGKIKLALYAGNPVIMADKIHITNVLINLLDNACKYSPSKPGIRIKTENSFSGIIISVKDNGIGINKANQKKIFDKLYRIPTGNLHNVKGFGLGLSYVKAIIEQHGGKIKLVSEVNKGSEFFITLPFSNE
ncbi:MAG: HAMP domain-containing histidine kinase [Bacteroidales bacterium]|nr:HAMP domain-containing histidine kinase [Bacteroidales bacterium]